MSTRITNTSRQALVVPLNSGNSIHIAPGETCDPLEEYETKSNPKIEKMSGSGLIALAHVEDDDDSGGGGTGAHAPRKRPKA